MIPCDSRLTWAVIELDQTVLTLLTSFAIWLTHIFSLTVSLLSFFLLTSKSDPQLSLNLPSEVYLSRRSTLERGMQLQMSMTTCCIFLAPLNGRWQPKAVLCKSTVMYKCMNRKKIYHNQVPFDFFFPPLFSWTETPHHHRMHCTIKLMGTSVY